MNESASWAEAALDSTATAATYHPPTPTCKHLLRRHAAHPEPLHTLCTLCRKLTDVDKPLFCRHLAWRHAAHPSHLVQSCFLLSYPYPLLPHGRARAGISRGAMQRIQSQVSKWAGMAAQLCASAGWWQMETMMSSLSEQADVGARPELLKLMTVGFNCLNFDLWYAKEFGVLVAGWSSSPSACGKLAYYGADYHPCQSRRMLGRSMSC